MNWIIETENLGKRYGDVKAVDGLSLRVAEGEIYTFLGLNGAGKTTTIRMLLGMIKPSAGGIVAGGFVGDTVAAGGLAVFASGWLADENEQAATTMMSRRLPRIR